MSELFKNLIYPNYNQYAISPYTEVLEKIKMIGLIRLIDEISQKGLTNKDFPLWFRKLFNKAIVPYINAIGKHHLYQINAQILKKKIEKVIALKPMMDKLVNLSKKNSLSFYFSVT